MKLFVDADGYICFRDGEVFWTLHSNGWEAFPDDKDWYAPIYESGDITFPTDEDLQAAQNIYLKRL